MEIMRADVDGLVGERLEAFGADVNHAILILEWSFDQQEPRACDHEVILFEQVRRDYDVGDTGFVFHRDEEKSFCCAGPLARNHTARGAYPCSVRLLLQVCCGKDSVSAQCFTAKLHGMTPDRETGSTVEPVINFV